MDAKKKLMAQSIDKVMANLEDSKSIIDAAIVHWDEEIMGEKPTFTLTQCEKRIDAALRKAGAIKNRLVE